MTNAELQELKANINACSIGFLGIMSVNIAKTTVLSLISEIETMRAKMEKVQRLIKAAERFIEITSCEPDSDCRRCDLFDAVRAVKESSK